MARGWGRRPDRSAPGRRPDAAGRDGSPATGAAAHRRDGRRAIHHEGTRALRARRAAHRGSRRPVAHVRGTARDVPETTRRAPRDRGARHQPRRAAELRRGQRRRVLGGAGRAPSRRAARRGAGAAADADRARTGHALARSPSRVPDVAPRLRAGQPPPAGRGADAGPALRGPGGPQLLGDGSCTGRAQRTGREARRRARHHGCGCGVPLRRAICEATPVHARREPSITIPRPHGSRRWAHRSIRSASGSRSTSSSR